MPKLKELDRVYQEESDRLDAELRPLLTEDFLAVLVRAVRTCGWSVDHVESAEFVEWCFGVAGKTPPSLEPFQ